MNSSEKRKHTTSPATYAVATAVALLAGFGTVYWLSTPSDNRSDAPSKSEPASKPGSSGTAGAGAGPLKGLNTGAMTAFVVRSEPVALPDFAFEKPGGGAISAADLKGKVVLLNIWATWCVPCREEMPQLNALQSELGGEGFEVVALNIDKGGPEKAEKFLAETGATDLKAYYDPSGKLFAKLKAVGMPTTLLIDADGKEMGRLVGPANWASPEAKAIVQAAIGATNGAANGSTP